MVVPRRRKAHYLLAIAEGHHSSIPSPTSFMFTKGCLEAGTPPIFTRPEIHDAGILDA
jgi:hypothetical protein